MHIGRRVALVTGGQPRHRGGRRTCGGRLRRRRIVHYGSDRTAAAAMDDSNTAAGHLAPAVQADLSRPEGPETLMRKFDSELNGLGLDRGLDILVNNAGINRCGALERVTVEDFDRLARSTSESRSS